MNEVVVVEEEGTYSQERGWWCNEIDKLKKK